MSPFVGPERRLVPAPAWSLLGAFLPRQPVTAEVAIDRLQTYSACWMMGARQSWTWLVSWLRSLRPGQSEAADVATGRQIVMFRAKQMSQAFLLSFAIVGGFAYADDVPDL